MARRTLGGIWPVRTRLIRLGSNRAFVLDRVLIDRRFLEQPCRLTSKAPHCELLSCLGPRSNKDLLLIWSLSYLYGNASSSSYAISVDGQTSTSFTSDLPSGLLLGKGVGMAFGKHTLVLRITQPSSLVSFSQAILTVGVGRGDRSDYPNLIYETLSFISTNNIQNRTLSAFITDSTGKLTVNPQFSYTGAWVSNPSGAIRRTNVTYPRRDTRTADASMTFTISQASAIFVYSDVNGDHGKFMVTFTPPPELGQRVITTYDGNAHWFSIDRVLFWAVGMDRDKSYTVEIANMATAASPYFDFSHVDILDATPIGPAISSPTSLSRRPTVVKCLLTFFRTATDVSKVKDGPPIGAIVGGTICLFPVYIRCHLNYADIDWRAYHPCHFNNRFLGLSPEKEVHPSLSKKYTGSKHILLTRTLNPNRRNKTQTTITNINSGNVSNIMISNVINHNNMRCGSRLPSRQSLLLR